MRGESKGRHFVPTDEQSEQSTVLEHKRKRKREKCKCDPLEKLIATNWAYYRCPKCGAEYFSHGNAKVIDKTDLGNIEERKKKGLI